MNRAWRSTPVAALMVLAATGSWAQSATALRSGIDIQFFDTSVRAQDDFYQYVNGRWLATTEIPADRPAYGADVQLYDDAQRALAELIKEAAAHASDAPGSDAAKIAALYNSFMDEGRAESLGSQPLATELAGIEAIRSKQELPALIAHLQEIGVTVPFSVSVHLDGMEPSRYVPDLQQDGLGLPDRDYYLLEDATTLRLIRRQYQTHIAASLKLLGIKDAYGEAAAIVALETRLAKQQSAKADVRDPLKTYHRVEIAALNSSAPGFDWHRYLMAAGINDRIGYVIVSEPDYLHAFARSIADIPLATWKSYLRWHLLSDFSPYLSKAYVDGSFAFFDTTLQGIPQNQPRWRRGVALVEQEIGQGIGKLYVQKYFSEQSKQTAERLVRNLLAAFQQDIASLAWMSPETRTEALRKLSRITIKIGYPNRWRDYSSLSFRDNDLVGNVMRASSFEFQRSIGKLGKPVDRTEWESTPQAVNAFYSPQMNEIVFPAAILRAPFFDVTVDDAANYGAIGMVIGHEISHAFDDQGSQYDGDGRLRDWWSTADHERFAALTAPLVNEYNGFMPMRGRQVNGELTLNENIADNTGLAIAHKAYWLSLKGVPAPVIDGLSGEQRFYIGFAQAWREKIRDNFAIELLQSDPHAIAFVRVIGTLVNQPGFYDTFSVKPGDRMYVPPDRRIIIW
jgi:putative endopeptidase